MVKMGTGAPVQAPYPTTLVRPDVAVPSFYKQVLVHGYVTAAGKVENLKVVRPIKPETGLAALARWVSQQRARASTSGGVRDLDSGGRSVSQMTLARKVVRSALGFADFHLNPSKRPNCCCLIFFPARTSRWICRKAARRSRWRDTRAVLRQ